MPEADVKVNVVLKDETLWLSQKGMMELFGCYADNIGLHLKNIFESGELEKSRMAENFSGLDSRFSFFKQEYCIL